MTEKVCSVCGGTYFARGLCKKHYYQRPEVKAKQKEYQPRYHQRPEVKARKKEYRQRRRVPPSQAVSDFFTHFSKKWFQFHSQEELQDTIQNYAENVCNIQGNCNNIIKKIKKNPKYRKIKEERVKK